MDNNKLPLHLGIILDGNRRWAKESGLNSLMGHRRGLNNLEKISQAAFKKGIKVVTVFAFSIENWKREEKEVSYLIKLFKTFVKKETNKLQSQGIKIKFFGRLSDFDKELRDDMKRVEKESQNNKLRQLNICLSYSGRDEVVRAVNKIIKKQPGQEISEQLINDNLDSRGISDPDLIIRTSGEQRLSGFLTWQSSYSEFYFSQKYWPDFAVKDLEIALADYAQRKRRFGKN